MSRSEFSGELRVDNEPVVRGRSPGEFRALDVNSDLYIGGVPSIINLPDALQNLGTDAGFYGNPFYTCLFLIKYLSILVNYMSNLNIHRTNLD